MPYSSPAQWDHWSPERIRDEQGKRLRTFLREQIAFSPFYRRLFQEHGIDPAAIRSVEDLERVPFTSKAEIAPLKEAPDRPRDLVLQPTPELIRSHWPLPRQLRLLLQRTFRGNASVVRSLEREYRPVSVFFTTGRSALPTAFTLSRYDLQLLEVVGARILEIAGVESNADRLVNIFPFAPHLAFWQVYYAGVGGNVFTLNTGGGKVMGSAAILQAIEKIQPAYLVGIPGYVYHLLRQAHSRSMDLSYLKGLALGGDQVTGGYRERIKDMLRDMGVKDPRVVSVFGFTESRKCWTECAGEEAGGFHTYPDLEIMEIIDPDTGKALPAGETGELVYTSLAGRGSCVLRYRTGDLVVGGMRLEPCPHCGRTVPRLASRLERVSNLKNFQLSKVKGTLVNLNVIKEELEANPSLEEWQLVISKRGGDPFDVDELQLNIALSGEAREGDTSAVEQEIEEAVFRVSEVRLNKVRVLPLEEVLDLLGMETQLKEKRIVDLRQSRDAAPAAAETTQAGSAPGA